MPVVGLLITLNLIGINQLSGQTAWLDQLDLSPATQGFGVPRKNKSVDGNTITIADKIFEPGVKRTRGNFICIQSGCTTPGGAIKGRWRYERGLDKV